METPVESIHVVPSPPESAAILRTIVELIRSIMHADVASIFGISLDDETVSWKAAAGFRSPEIDYERTVRRPVPIGRALEALTEHRVIVLEGPGSTSNLPVYMAEGVDYVAAAPLRISGNRSGVVAAGFRAPHHFSDNEKKLLQDLAEMASLTLDNARLQEIAGESEATLKLARVFAQIGTLDWNIQNGINTWSPELEQMYGLPPGDVEAQTVWADLVHPDDRAAVIACVLQAFETRQPVEAEWRVTWPDGSIHWLLGRFQLFEDEAGRPVRLTGINLDITERKRSEKALAEMQEKLAKSHRLAAIGQLAAGVAHEVNNPLATITTCAEGMIRDMRDQENKNFAASRRWDVYAEEIVRQTLRCKQITRGLLDLTRQREARKVWCDINALVRDCTRVAALRDGLQVEFKVKVDESIARIATDAEMVRQILVNLLGNAIDAIEEHNQPGRITVSTINEADRVVIEVSDSGGGVSPELLARIFDPFFSTKKNGKGYGLGLSISSTLAESLGGGLSVDSKTGEGSKFRLWLPQLAAE